ncbi:MAG TPA: gluconate 2-dehydrogenase subunit 3 family protein [Acidobacteriota bacterium]|nr:gluconate 2-dehydrogenase subunit 3 family protein [Acidobacteriota bacterium]
MSEQVHPLPKLKSLSRREMLRRFAAAVVVAGNCTFSPEAARHVHEMARESLSQDGAYAPQFFKPHEFATLQRLTELIIPADDRSGSARQAGAPEFIDLLCSQNDELADIYSGGLLWLEGEARREHGDAFLALEEADQASLLELLAAEVRRLDALEEAERSAVWGENTNFGGFSSYRSVPAGRLGPGARFFAWLRRMTVDAFYTSQMGIADLDYQGNTALAEYTVPDEVLEYVRNQGSGK